MSLITPEQGSAGIAILQFILALLTLPTILRPDAAVPRTGSVPTAAALWAIAAIFALMGLEAFWTAALGSGICAVGWTLIAVLRPTVPEGDAFLSPISLGDYEEPQAEVPPLPRCNGSECENRDGLQTHSADCARVAAFQDLSVDMGFPA